MNKQKRENKIGRLERQALRLLEEAPGVSVRWPTQESGACDAVLRFADREQPICIEYRRYANAAGAWEMVRRAETNLPSPSLVVAGRMTKEARGILRRHRIALVDAEGNAHVEFPGLLIHTEAQRREVSVPKGKKLPTRLNGRAGVAAQALLLEPTRDWRITDLAARAKISSSFAHRVFVRLEGEGVVEAAGAGPKKVRRVVNPSALLDLWAEEAEDRHVSRVRAFRLAQNPNELGEAVVAALDERGMTCALTGAAAAARIAPLISAVPVAEIWLADGVLVEEAIEACAAERVETGHNVLLAQTQGDAPLSFRHQEQGVWTVNVFRLYLDLRMDPKRGQEQADHIRQEVIGF